jgi:hypothetical protein
VAYQYYSVKHFELRIWFGEKVKGEGLKVFSSPFPLFPLSDKYWVAYFRRDVLVLAMYGLGACFCFKNV